MPLAPARALACLRRASPARLAPRRRAARSAAGARQPFRRRRRRPPGRIARRGRSRVPRRAARRRRPCLRPPQPRHRAAAARPARGRGRRVPSRQRPRPGLRSGPAARRFQPDRARPSGRRPDRSRAGGAADAARDRRPPAARRRLRADRPDRAPDRGLPRRGRARAGRSRVRVSSRQGLPAPVAARLSSASAPSIRRRRASARRSAASTVAQGQPQRARVAFEAAAARDPRLAEVHLALAQLAADDGRWDDAAREVALELAVQPTSREALALRARIDAARSAGRP